ncbi:MAG: LysM peptidoglycan-binding domain-containing protein, partial [Gammaproteobacteria bacterium]|nr:LysM peptidoglycan-binding domain-containing protein [Gammaproteobacteria bacterium]
MAAARRFRNLGLLAAVGATIVGCGGADSVAPVGRPAERAPPARVAASPAPAAGVHVVTRGDTLYSIAWRYAFDYRELARWNGIRAPYTIYPGQRIRLTPPAAPVSARTGSGSAEQRRHPIGTSRRQAEPPPAGARTQA